jgi:hypothetical protein
MGWGLNSLLIGPGLCIGNEAKRTEPHTDCSKETRQTRPYGGSKIVSLLFHTKYFPFLYSRPSSFGFTLLILIPPLLRAHLSPLPELCNNPEQAAPYHILSVEAWLFASGPALNWLESKRYAMQALSSARAWQVSHVGFPLKSSNNKLFKLI